MTTTTEGAAFTYCSPWLPYAAGAGRLPTSAEKKWYAYGRRAPNVAEKRNMDARRALPETENYAH